MLVLFDVLLFYIFYSEKAKEEFNKLRKQMKKDRSKEQEINRIEAKQENSAVAEFVDEANRFKEISEKIPKKGQGREEMVPF